MARSIARLCRAVPLLVWMAATSVAAQEPTGGASNGPPPASAEETKIEAPLWHYGAYLDLSYDVNFNFPSNHLFRSRTTADRTNELDPNMGLVYVRKDATAESRWGMEFGAQGGYDTKEFAFLQGEPKVGGADTLRHFSRANVSYLAPVSGKDLTVTAGLFNSLIGYESLYAKDNFNYTRSWIADNTPYMMFGVNARYALNDQLTATAFVINSYYHLAHPNDQPSYGGQLSWKPTSRITMTQTVYYGPDQANTSLEFWRLYTNHITEWKSDDVTLALAYDFGTENIAGQPGSPRAFVMGGALFTRWHIAGPWAIAVRPEFYWDRNGRWTGSQQLVKAVATTLEYKAPYRWTNVTLRLEHRYDDSTGKQAGFFTGSEISPGVIRLTPGQHLLILGLLWTFDSP
ncbi:MAG: porin [Nitrospirae bacterium]|nr:MAG: porin [Nitrospirota bacterium]